MRRGIFVIVAIILVRKVVASLASFGHSVRNNPPEHGHDGAHVRQIVVVVSRVYVVQQQLLPSGIGVLSRIGGLSHLRAGTRGWGREA
jgi:hypothetical protein